VESLREIFNNIGPHMPFMMATAPGKMKVNGTRLIEISMLIAFLWYQGEALKVDIKEMQSRSEKALIEFKEDKARTEQRLGVLEEDIKDIKKVVYKPINGEPWEKYK
jgi:hypothetical protein